MSGSGTIQSLDLSKFQLEFLVRREEDSTIKVEIEESKSGNFIITYRLW